MWSEGTKVTVDGQRGFTISHASSWTPGDWWVVNPNSKLVTVNARRIAQDHAVDPPDPDIEAARQELIEAPTGLFEEVPGWEWCGQHSTIEKRADDGSLGIGGFEPLYRRKAVKGLRPHPDLVAERRDDLVNWLTTSAPWHWDRASVELLVDAILERLGQ